MLPEGVCDVSVNLGPLRESRLGSSQVTVVVGLVEKARMFAGHEGLNSVTLKAKLMVLVHRLAKLGRSIKHSGLDLVLICKRP